MSQPGVIDGLQFARTGSEMRGTIGPAQLPRLAEMSCGVDEIAYAIKGGLNAEGKLCLRVQVSGTLQLVCQRCLGPIAHPVAVDVELELSDSLREIAQADDDVDRVLASPAMDAAQLVEDELILGLPLSPRHEGCESAVQGSGESSRPSPFGVLERLKKH
ncbi:MAG: hypothetical protein A2W04_06890 [Betaproteobacteria bacterium RBG_16_64_9]|nr:MAG: hypothetical protein A2W04_06890 [Betaproteobacteria bacterium RBG_16_64_9]OGA27994.1 MAG: hypothetical protein A3I01_19300 [Betaproteobacteria bacterium RIFCSPLOWO2_02_FULL_65_24]OGA95739.1 MAG: hypothetical protein A3G27_10315 [Betaproteobacteria bacterium RIFCSPLOWO2_12_FULL_66_14]